MFKRCCLARRDAMISVERLDRASSGSIWYPSPAPVGRSRPEPLDGVAALVAAFRPVG